MYTADWSDADVNSYLDFCDYVETEDPSVFLQVWANESDNRASAHNPNGDASGIFQLMPQTAKGLGYDVASDPHLDRYRASGVSGQLVWAAKYYGNHKGQLGTVARAYLCTFLPALLSCGDDLNHSLAAHGGTLGWAYDANPGFDVAKKGWITVGDLVSAAQRATGPRTRELIARVLAAKVERTPTEPEIPGA